MAWPYGERSPSAIGALVGLCLCVMLGMWAIQQDRHERALVAGGHCVKITEALYTPPPSAHSSCYGDGAYRSCSTRYSQADPYMRSLWRCQDDDDTREFWRRTSEEFEE